MFMKVKSMWFKQTNKQLSHLIVGKCFKFIKWCELANALLDMQNCALNISKLYNF